MAITPTQNRFIDPFSDIFSDKVNERMKVFFPTGKSIIRGLLLSIDNTDLTKIHVSHGDAIKDYVVLNFTEDTEIDVSTLTDGTYFIVIEYTYSKVTPPPEAKYDVVDNTTDRSNYITLGSFAVTNGSCVEGSINYDDRTGNDFYNIVKQIILEDGIDSDLDMNGHKILHLGVDASSIQDLTDGVNKAYVDTSVGDYKVKVNDTDSTSSFLVDKLVPDTDHLEFVVMDADSNPDSPTMTPGANHVLYMKGIDNIIQVESGDDKFININDKEEVQEHMSNDNKTENKNVLSGDSSSGYLADKMDVIPPITKTINTDTEGNKTLEIGLHDTISKDLTFAGSVDTTGDTPKLLRTDKSTEPLTDMSVDLGSFEKKFKTIYANRFEGTAANADILNGFDPTQYLNKNADSSILTGSLEINQDLKVHGQIICGTTPTDCSGAGSVIGPGGNPDPDPLGDGSGIHLYRLNGDMNDDANTWNGGLTGGTWDDNGRFGKCLAINDENSFASIFDLSSFTKNVTISFWVYIPSDGGNLQGLYYSQHIQVYSTGIINHYGNNYITTNEGNYCWNTQWCDTDIYTYHSDSTLWPINYPKNTWFNLTIVMEDHAPYTLCGSTNGRWGSSSSTCPDGCNYGCKATQYEINAYINGNKLSCGGPNLTQPETGLKGSLNNGTSNVSGYLGYGPDGFRGKIDHVRIFNRALTSEEVTQLIQTDAQF